MQSMRVVMGLVGILVLPGADHGWAQLPAATGGKERSLQSAPVNPAFQEYLVEVRSGKRTSRTADGHPLGLIPSPMDFSHLSVKGAARIARDPSLPVSYDLRTHDKVTPVKDQGQHGACWSFATYGSLESCLLPGATADFSENNLANLSGFDIPFDDGGSAIMSSAYLTRWSGPVLEADDPYANIGGSPANLQVQSHVQQIRIVPDRDNNGIKRAVIDFGGVYTTLRWDTPSYNTNSFAHYYAGDDRGNHAVMIAGWDDNYDRTRFSPAAPNNGAWIVRNSWNTNWGEKGYFYCSYDDTRVAFNNFVFMNAESATNYSRVYQYDPLGCISSFGGGQTAWGANLFVNAEDAPSTIAAASFYALTTNTSYQLFVYTGVAADAPRSGTLRATASGTLAMAGYYTIPLNPPAPLAANERFSVVVQLTTPGFNYPLAAEYAKNGWSSKATAAMGQSFYSPDGTRWTDFITVANNPTINLCIKAFALPSTPPIVQTPSATVAAPPRSARTGDEPVAIETAVGQSFTLVTPSSEPVDIFLGFNASPAEADLRLMFTGNQSVGGLSGQTFATLFDGRWMTIGTRAAVKTFGKTFALNEGVSSSDGVKWVFGHSLKTGQSCGIYQKRNGQWVNTHTVTCK